MEIEQLRFIEQNTLKTRGPVDSEPDEECEMFLRSETSVLRYSAEGTQDVLLSFEQGVKILIEQGVYDFAVPTPKK